MVRRRLIALLALPLLASMGAQGRQPLPFEAEIKAFEAQDAKAMPPKGGILFIGSSSIRLWKTLEADFPGLPVINRGFGGSSISHSILYTPRIVLPYEPGMIVFFAGTNDLQGGKSPAQVFEDWKTFVSGVQKTLPNTRFAFLGITPAPSRWNNLDKVQAANRLIRDWCLVTPNVHFIETFPYFTTPEGGPRPELFVSDQLHLNDRGYDIWRSLVRPLLPWRLPESGPGSA